MSPPYGAFKAFVRTMTQSAISPTFLELWNLYGTYVAYVLFIGGLLVVAGYFLKLSTLADYRKRYDYINMYEIRWLWGGFVMLLIGLTIWLNTGSISEKLQATWSYFLVTFFVSGMMCMIVAVIVQNVLKFYYPFFIEKRLKKLRFAPRMSPEGRLMKLLSEEEEDVYLDEGMQAEEDVFSMDYDVWIDEESGFTKIEQYNGCLHALVCTKCSYQTLRVNKEEVVQPATVTEEGELVKYFLCGYCGHKERKSFKIVLASKKSPNLELS